MNDTAPTMNTPEEDAILLANLQAATLFQRLEDNIAAGERFIVLGVADDAHTEEVFLYIGEHGTFAYRATWLSDGERLATTRSPLIVEAVKDIMRCIIAEKKGRN